MEPDYKSIFEGSPGLYLVLDPSLRILAASDAYLQATLTDRAGIVGRLLFDVFPDNPDDPSADAIRNTRASFSRVLHSGVADAMVVQRHDVRRPDSEGGGFEVRYWSTVNSPILNPDGSVACLLHRGENVTEFVLLKEHGQQQARLTDELRERAVQMEADLYARSREVADANLKLKLANERLEGLYARSLELDTLKSQFLANASHELRTPLTLILAPLEQLLLREDLKPPVRKALAAVQRSAHLLQRHADDLLDITRLETGHMLVHYVRTDLAALTRLAASHFHTPAADRKIRLEVHAPPSLQAAVDPEKIERMLLNLLSNAFKFTADRGAIRLSLRKIDGRAVIEVEDNGPGIPESLREAIFERFRQDEGGMARQHGGIGLGLAIVRELAHLHHGSVAAGAALMGGALFRIELPLIAPAGAQVAEAVPPDANTARRLAHAKAQAALHSRALPVPANVSAPHILIVEDNPDMNAFLCEALGRHYWISRAFDGNEGMQKALLADRPDLIIADVMMPGMSGDTMVDGLRRNSALEDVPIVVLTAKADESLRVELLRRGIQGYLQKPFLVDELLARVQSLLANRKRTEGRMRQSEEHYRTLFNSIDQGFCIFKMIFDDSGKAVDYLFLETNPAFEQQTGLFDAQGKRMRELVPDLEDHWFEVYGRVAETGEAVRFQNHAEHLGRWFDAYAFRYGDRENRQVAVLFSDITARRKTEEALRDAERRKDQFLALLAHELRNPLAPIRNAVHVLRMTPAANSVPTSQLLPMMERQLAHMARLLDDLLDVSRIANGRIELHKERIDVTPAVQVAIEANQPIIGAMGHHLTVAFPSQPVLLDADPARLTQIVSNLLHNAATYSAPGSGIQLTAGRDGGDVAISVKDTGAGLRPDELDLIFEMFVQAGTPFSRSHGGLGLGLSLVRTLVGMHGGRVEARSAGLGHGSEFIFWLPALAESPCSAADAGNVTGSGP